MNIFDIISDNNSTKLLRVMLEQVAEKMQTATAEGLFMLVLRVIDGNELSDVQEVYDTESILCPRIVDFAEMADRLQDFCEKYPATADDETYLVSRFQDAMILATRADTAVTLPMLMGRIMNNPSGKIRRVLAPATTPKEPNIFDEINKAHAKTETAAPQEATAPREPEYQQPVAEEVPADPAENKGEMTQLISEVKRIRGELSSQIFGQDNAIDTFITGYFRAEMLSMTDRKRKLPKATFLFAGPPGVGKTYMAEQIAEALKLPFMRFDMSEYADKEASIEFCGSDKVYKQGKEGNVTSFAARNPKSVLLFDEIEKAHISVIYLFLQMLDAGRLRDNNTDQEVSFTDTIIILTTNAGRQLYEDSDTTDLSSVSRKVIIQALRDDVNPATNTPFFPAAICSRFASGNVVMFNHMTAQNLQTIADKELSRHMNSFKQETGIDCYCDPRVSSALLFAEGASADARTIRGRAEAFFNDELYELMRLIESKKVKTSISNIEHIDVTVDLSHASKEILALFETDSDSSVLVFGDEAIAKGLADRLPEFNIFKAADCGEAIEILKERDIDFVLLDMIYGASAEALLSLNIEDVESPARDFFKFISRHRGDIPTYILDMPSDPLTDEERISFMKQGVRGVLDTSDMNYLAEKVKSVGSCLYQQASMIRLARESKLVNFETAQTVSADGKKAQIKLFDFKLSVAVDSADSKNVLSGMSKPNIKFDDIIGAESAKKELTYFVDYLKNPKKYMGTGTKAPKGIILYGPPGTGKTMLAKAMAGESNLTYIVAEGNEFLKKYSGEGPEKVHELFKIARKYAPSVLFIDEIDAIAKERRGGGSGSGGAEETLTALLTEMDGFINDATKPVFVLAATNFEVESGSDKSLDPALMRRFDRRIRIDLPNMADRIRFLNMKVTRNRYLKLSDKLINNIGLRSTGMSLAQLDSTVEFALRSVILQGKSAVDDAAFEEAFETFNNGEAKSWDVSELERTARHEAGHAFICHNSGSTPAYLTIVARGNHGGYMQHLSNEQKGTYTKEELLSLIRTSLGGRAAEIVYYGNEEGVSTGASGDLAKATSIARSIICTYGMDEGFGLAVDSVGAKEPMTKEVRDRVNQILSEEMAKAIGLISANREKIDSLVEQLMLKNNLSGEEIKEILEK